MPPTECPKCHADLRETWIEENGERKTGSRVEGLYDPNRDLTDKWRCPDCGAEWERNFGTVRQTPKPPPMRRPSDESE